MLKLCHFLALDQYLTRSITHIFYMLQLVLIGLFCLSRIFASLSAMMHSFLTGVFLPIGTLRSSAIALIAARIATEIIMVLFQNNEHLAVIRAPAESQ